MDEVRNDGHSLDAKTHCDLLGRGRRASQPPILQNHYEITNEITTTHCSVLMLTRSSDEAGPSP